MTVLTPAETIEAIRQCDAEAFKKVQAAFNNLAGFIIAWWRVDEEDEPAAAYWSECRSAAFFGDEGRSEDPQIYKTKRGMLERIKRLQKDPLRAGGLRHDRYAIGIGWWTFPDLPAYPLPKYMLMERPFPGCPRQ